MVSEEHRKRLAIEHILSDPHIGFFRLCGRELQTKYRLANMTHQHPDRAALLQEIIDVYLKTLDNKQPPMAPKEKKHKTKLILKFANKQWEDKH